MRYIAKNDIITGIWTIHKSNSRIGWLPITTLCDKILTEFQEMSAAEYRIYVELGYQSCEKCDRIDYK